MKIHQHLILFALLFQCVTLLGQKGFSVESHLSKGLTFSHMDAIPDEEDFPFKPGSAVTHSRGYGISYGLSERIAFDGSYDLLMRKFRIKSDFSKYSSCVNYKTMGHKLSGGARYRLPLSQTMNLNLMAGAFYYFNPVKGSGRCFLSGFSPPNSISFAVNSYTVGDNSYGNYFGTGLEKGIGQSSFIRLNMYYNHSNSTLWRGDLNVKQNDKELHTDFSGTGSYLDFNLGFVHNFKERPEKYNEVKCANNTIMAEVIGTGMFLSLIYDRILLRESKVKVSGQIGASIIPFLFIGKGEKYKGDFLIPVGMSFLYGNNGNLEAGMGMLHANSPDGIEFMDFTGWQGYHTFPYYLIGYRFQKPEGGYFLKTHVTLFHARTYTKFFPLPSLSLGYSF